MCLQNYNFILTYGIMTGHNSPSGKKIECEQYGRLATGNENQPYCINPSTWNSPKTEKITT